MYWGGCPACYGNDGFLNAGRDHWFICREHKVRWWYGSNLFSIWRDQSREDHARQAAELRGYREIEPWYPFPVRLRFWLTIRLRQLREFFVPAERPF